MDITKIADFEFANTFGQAARPYDVALFASGFEMRARHIAEQVNAEFAEEVYCLGFQDERAKDAVRLENDRVISSIAGRSVISARADDADVVYRLLNDSLRGKKRPRLFIDYTSMSKQWYAAVLCWSKYNGLDIDGLSIDFMYSVGEHSRNRKGLVIRDLYSMPGCTGTVAVGKRNAVAIGLGFDSAAARVVLERLQSDEVLAFYARPGAVAGDDDAVEEFNKELLAASGVLRLPLPLRSVERAYRSLTQLVATTRSDCQVIIAPMGPKPLVLASLLTAHAFDDVACLRVSTHQNEPENVTAAGEIVGVRVQIERTPIV